MATALSIQLTAKTGEHLVTAELARRGIMATPFSGNVPEIDILGYANHIAIPIQVKAINGISWQFDVKKFLDVKIFGSEQKVNGLNPHLKRDLSCIFVVLGERLADAEYYVFKYGWLQDYFRERYKGRRAPNNINSFHCAVWKKDMARHLGKWGIVERAFKMKAAMDKHGQ